MELVTRRLNRLLFVTVFIGFAYFQQGGGWNQNGRFAMVRAMVEQQKFSIDSYLIYVRAKPDPSTALRRIEVVNAEYQTNGQANVLMWLTQTGQIFPVNNILEGNVAAIDPSRKTIEVEDTHKVRIRIALSETTEIKLAGTPITVDMVNIGAPVRIFCGLDKARGLEANIITLLDREHSPDHAFKELGAVAATGDVAFYRGHFYPNKSPGTSFAGALPYWLIFHFEKIIGANPDDWWTLTVNAWLTSVFSVGLISALGVPLFYRLAYALSGGSSQTSLIAACIFAFGTMFFPIATLFYEHNIIGVALLASFYLLYRVKSGYSSRLDPAGLTTTRVALYLFLAGLFAGWAAITNYIFAVVAIFLGTYLIFSVNRKTGWLWFALGLLGPLLLICAYNVACFDTPFTTNYQYQNPDFKGNANSFLNVFTLPRWDILLIILFSPFRGLFFTAPVLLMAIVGLFLSVRDSRLRSEALLIGSGFAFCLLFNVSFNGWDGGETAVPRYLGPAIPFLTLGTVFGLRRFFKTTFALAILSIAIMLLITAVDPQPPIGTGEGSLLDKPEWQYNPFGEYDLPVFVSRRPLPLLRQQEEQAIYYYDRQLATEGWTEAARGEETQRARHEIERQIAAGEPATLVLARTGKGPETRYWIGDSHLSVPVGPVSAHDGGYYGSWSEGGFGALGSIQARWNSFNLGEFFFPESRWSLLPLLIIGGFICWRAFLIARRLDISDDSLRSGSLPHD